MKIRNLLNTFLGLMFLIVPAIIFFYMVDKFSLNVPYYDEYISALDWLNSYFEASSFKRYSLLIQQANEHRLLAYYLSVLWDYILNGSVNFRQILIFGNLGILLLAYLIYKLIPVEKNKLLFFAPISLLLFIYQYEINNWAIVAIGAVWYITLIILALMLLKQKTDRSFYLAILLTIFSTFSFGGGVFVFLVGFIVLFLNPNKKRKHCYIWSVAMILSMSLFFTNYNFNAGPQSDTNFLDHPFETIQYGLVFFGTIFSSLFKGQIIYYTISGFLVLLFFFALLIWKWEILKTQTVIISIIFFILFSAGAAAITRVAFGVGAATAPRYILLQAVFLALLYILVLMAFKQKRNLILIISLLLGMIIYWGRLTDNYNANLQHKIKLQEHLLRYYKNLEDIGTEFPPPQMARQIITESINKGYYHPPSIKDLYSEIQIIHQNVEATNPHEILYHIDNIEVSSDIIEMKGWAILKSDNTLNQTIIIGLENDKINLLFSTEKIIRPDVVQYFNKENYDFNKYCGFNLVLDQMDLNLTYDTINVYIGILQSGEIKALKKSNITINNSSTKK